MQFVLPDADYQKINSFINSKLGLNFPIERKRDLAKALYNAADEFELKSITDLITYLTTSKISDNEFQILSKHLTIGETYFFRENVIFDILKKDILPKIVSERAKKNKKVKIWSAGCSSGEETYSLALIINEMLLNKNGWDVTILGTDINPDNLKKARMGDYSEWSFRDVDEYIKEKYFQNTEGKRYSILPRIKEMVEFNQLNLVEDSFPSIINKTNALDIILCRNVLMYFEPKKREKVISAFYNSLVTGGWLILGLTEIGYMADKRFKTISMKDAVIFQKSAPAVEISQRKTKSLPATSEFTSPKPSKGLYRRPTARLNSVSTEKKTTRNIYKDAKQLYDIGDYNEAAKLFTRFIEIDEARDQDDKLGKVYYYLAMSLANAGRIGSALDWCEKGILKYKLDPALYFLKSNLLQGMGKYEECISTLKKTIYLDSNYIMAYFSLGNIFKRLGRNDEAKRQFKQLLILLNQYDDSVLIKDSEGMTASRIKELVKTFVQN